MRTERSRTPAPVRETRSTTAPTVGAPDVPARNTVRPGDGVDAPKSTRSIDGEAFCKAQLADIKLKTSHGEKVRVVFDIDDTLADTRARTLGIAHAFDKKNGTHYFDKLNRSEVGHRAEDTAQAMGLPAKVVKDFSAYWNVEFWKGENLKFDKPMQKIIDLAKQAKAAGADVTYLTGRYDGIRSSTLEQLKAFGLPDADEKHLFCKPTIGTRTTEYKRDMLTQWRQDGFQIGWFFTESRRDVAFIQQELPTMSTVLLAAAKEKGGDSVRADTPIFDSVTRTRRYS